MRLIQKSPLESEFTGQSGCRLVAAALLLCLHVIAWMVLARSLSGAFTVTFMASSYFLLIVTMLGIGLMANTLFFGFDYAREDWPVRSTAGALSLLPSLLLQFALAPPGVRVAVAGAAIFWLLGAASLAWGATGPLVRQFWNRVAGAAWLGSPVVGAAARPAPMIDVEANPKRGEHDVRERAGADVSSRITRRKLPDGEDRLEGIASAEFAAGQKQTAIHLAFCPPFTVAPKFTCELLDDSSARLKAGAVYPYGVRLELKRNEATEAALIRVQFTAVRGCPIISIIEVWRS